MKKIENGKFINIQLPKKTMEEGNLKLNLEINGVNSALQTDRGLLFSIHLLFFVCVGISGNSTRIPTAADLFNLIQ